MIILELALIIILLVLSYMIIKHLFKKILSGLFILGLCGVISFIYKISYEVTLISIVMIICAIKFIMSELKHMGSDFIKPCRLYSNGLYEKMTALLFSINYIIFICLCSILLLRRNLYITNISDFLIICCVTWIIIWSIGRIRTIIFNCLDNIDPEVEYKDPLY